MLVVFKPEGTLLDPHLNGSAIALGRYCVRLPVVGGECAAKIVQYVQEGLTGEEQLQLEAALSMLLDKPVEMEEAIITQVLDELSEVAEAVDIFLSELELQSELVFLGARSDQAVLLLCIPVAFIAGDSPRQLATSTDDMEELTHVLLETDVVGSQTRLGLLPRLFCPEELVTQSYGTLRRLTSLMGEQILAGDPVRLEPGILAEGLPASAAFAWGNNPCIELCYLVGAVVTHESDLDDVFPAVGAETTDAEMHQLEVQVQADLAVSIELGAPGEPEPLLSPAAARGAEIEQEVPSLFSEHPPGRGPAGEDWEEVFLGVVDEVFLPMVGAQSTLLPDDFHENLRRGLELWRQQGLQAQISNGFHEDEAVIITAQPYHEADILSPVNEGGSYQHPGHLIR